MYQDDERVSLQSLCDGAAIERFDIALAEVVENVLDINTDPKVTREITLKLKFKPNEDRTYAHVEMAVSSKVAPLAPVQTIMTINPNASSLHEMKQPKQQNLNIPNVTPFKEKMA